MGLFSLLPFASRRTPTTLRFGSPDAAIRAATTVRGAHEAMVQFGTHRPVALAALTQTTHAIRDLPAQWRSDSSFWVDAFRGNPLLAMPETQPEFVRRLLSSKPTSDAALAVSAEVKGLRTRLEQVGGLQAKRFHNLDALTSELRERATLSAWFAPRSVSRAR